MLILHVIVDLRVGGAELMLKRLVASHAGSAAYTHRVISLRSRGAVGAQLEEIGVTVEALGMETALQAFGTYRKLKRRIKELQPDVVQTWMYHADFLGGIAARRARIANIIWGVRIADISARLGTSPMTTLVRKACSVLSSRVPSRIVYVAEAARKVHENLGYDSSKSIVIPNGYELPNIATRERIFPSIRADLAIDQETELVGSAGRYNRQKDHQSFVRACAILAAHRTDIQFVLLGRGVDHGNEELTRWIDETGFANRFHLLGERQDPDRCLAALDIFCLHSLEEGFPNVVAEAMALAVPCVVTDVGDAAALIGESGLVVPPADPMALAQALDTLLAEPVERRAERGRQARARIADHFSIERVRSRYEELYRDLMNHPAASNQTIATTARVTG